MKTWEVDVTVIDGRHERRATVGEAALFVAACMTAAVSEDVPEVVVLNPIKDTAAVTWIDDDGEHTTLVLPFHIVRNIVRGVAPAAKRGGRPRKEVF